ncbi:hypothetical protein [Treponema sp. OMZ 857]|uniref:hypothetical protein n=1 Tax=Treponema sp. OMZ 857 TaxID=1643513 RepID=UPI0020A5D39C|nr:hypothetical protein [Treponema sp. OMZ 857]UTC42639.1 hypothetical protein E4N66_00985 [Treponema sp. OMZ 857]
MPNTTKRPAGKNHPADIQNANNRVKKYISVISAVLLLCAVIGCNGPVNNPTPTPTPTAKGAYAPTDVKAELDSNTVNGITISWTSTGAKTYWVYYNTSNDSSTAKVLTDYTFSSKYSTTLSETGTYYFWVRAADDFTSSSSLSSFSNVAPLSFTYTTLQVPANVQAELSTEKLNTITVSWTTTGAKYYWVYYGTTNNTASAILLSDTVSSTSYSKSFSASGTYYFWVKSADGYNNTDQTSDFSNGVSCTLTHQNLPVPTNLAASKDGTGDRLGIKLTWDSTRSAYYHVYWGTTDDVSAATELDTFVRSNLKQVSAKYNNLVSGTTYYFWVKSADGYNTDDNTSAFSAVASYTWTE